MYNQIPFIAYSGNESGSIILVFIFCEFAMLLDLYILLCPQEEEVHSVGTYVDIWQHIHQKDYTLCLSLNNYASVIHKKQDCKTNCFIIGPPSVDF